MTAFLTGVKGIPNAVLIFISFIAKDVEQAFVFIGHLYFFFKIYTFENGLFNEFAHQLIGLFVLLMLKSCFYLYMLTYPVIYLLADVWTF